MSGIVERLLFCADVGDMGRKPDPTNVYRVAASTIDELASLLIAADKVIVWESHDLGRDFSDKVELAIAKAKGGAA
jgi:hypothetical protein